MNRRRHPAGVPTGGQFAPSERAESGVSLAPRAADLAIVAQVHHAITRFEQAPSDQWAHHGLLLSADALAKTMPEPRRDELLQAREALQWAVDHGDPPARSGYARELGEALTDALAGDPIGTARLHTPTTDSASADLPDPETLTPRELRGKCQPYAEAAVAADPSLRLVRGWYTDPQWGREEHWWTVRPDGSIYDPTARQFPMGGVTEWYEEFDGLYPCVNCGAPTPEGDLVGGGCCSGSCYGSMVGVPC